MFEGLDNCEVDVMTVVDHKSNTMLIIAKVMSMVKFAAISRFIWMYWTVKR